MSLAGSLFLFDSYRLEIDALAENDKIRRLINRGDQALALADAVGERRTQNQPGTTDEYPNWRVPLAGPDGKRLYLEDVFTDRRAAALAEALRAATDPSGG